MALKNGCNMGTPAKASGTHSTRMNPMDFERNNLSKGGVNDTKFLVKSNQTQTGTAKRK